MGCVPVYDKKWFNAFYAIAYDEIAKQWEDLIISPYATVEGHEIDQVHASNLHLARQTDDHQRSLVSPTVW